MKSPLQKNAMRTTVFGTQFIVRPISFQAEISMWNIFDQLEMYMTNGDDHGPMEMLHEA